MPKQKAESRKRKQKAKSKNRQIKPFDAWWCETCQSEEMSRAEAMQHLREKHGVNTEGLKVKRTCLLHLDGREFFASKYQIEIQSQAGVVVMDNEVQCRRAKDDMMRFC